VVGAIHVCNKELTTGNMFTFGMSSWWDDPLLVADVAQRRTHQTPVVELRHLAVMLKRALSTVFLGPHNALQIKER
jgi:hypothetical protein